MSEIEFLSHDRVCLSRSFPIPREAVWEMLSDPLLLNSWFLPIVAIDTRLGGSYRVSNDTGALTGTLTEFDPPRLINFGGTLRFELIDCGESTQFSFSLFRDSNCWVPSTLADFCTMLDNLERLLGGKTAYNRSEYTQARRQHYVTCEDLVSKALAGGGKAVHRVYFPLGESEPLVQDSELHELIQLLLAIPTLGVMVDGFADEPCSPEDAFSLSLLRTERVKNELLNNVIAPDRITIRAFGNSYKLYDPKHNLSHRNRRVELIPLF